MSQKVIWVNSQKKTLCWSKRLWAFWNIDIELRTRKSRVVWECQLPNRSSTSSRPYLSDVSFLFSLFYFFFFAEYCYSLSHVFRFRLFYPSRWPPTHVLYSHLTPSRESRVFEKACNLDFGWEWMNTIVKLSLTELSLILKNS